MRAMFSENTQGEVFNLGNPNEHTVLDYAHEIIKLCNSRSNILFEPVRVDDPERRRPDITKARQVLGWEPRIEKEEGLRQTIAWFKTQIPNLSSVL